MGTAGILNDDFFVY